MVVVYQSLMVETLSPSKRDVKGNKTFPEPSTKQKENIMNIIRIHTLHCGFFYTALIAGSINMGSKHANFNDTIYTRYPDWNQSTISYPGTNLIGAGIETSPHG